MRWLARPIRCASRLAPFGAPTCTTRSTSPQSMPRSRVEVATTARSLPADHRRLDLAPLPAVERAVMQRDRKRIVVDAPELGEEQLRLPARVDEEERRLVRLDRVVDGGKRVERGVPLPGDARLLLGRFEDRKLRLRAAFDDDLVGEVALRPASCATSQAQRSSGSATVAESPIVFRPGASVRSRASPSERRSPRFETTSECSSSKITVVSRAKKRRASFDAIRSATCSGVVSRMSGGSSFWRWRL